MTFKVGDFVKVKKKLTGSDMREYGVLGRSGFLLKKYNHGSHEVMAVEDGDIALRDDNVMFGQWWFSADWFKLSKKEEPTHA